MEGGLWRRDTAMQTQTYEELALEREGDGFFVQHWCLSLGKNKPDEEQLCYVMETEALVRKNLLHVFPKETIPAFEVIVPKDRLRFYMLRGE